MIVHTRCVSFPPPCARVWVVAVRCWTSHPSPAEDFLYFQSSKWPENDRKASKKPKSREAESGSHPAFYGSSEPLITLVLIDYCRFQCVHNNFSSPHCIFTFLRRVLWPFLWTISSTLPNNRLHYSVTQERHSLPPHHRVDFKSFYCCEIVKDKEGNFLLSARGLLPS